MIVNPIHVSKMQPALTKSMITSAIVQMVTQERTVRPTLTCVIPTHVRIRAHATGHFRHTPVSVWNQPFIGPNCSERRDLCEPRICQFNSSCMSDGFTYMCDCYDNYYGLNCKFLDLCTFDPCQNEGNCTRLNGTEGYTCDCPPAWTDSDCLTDVNECLADPCLNGNCSNKLGTFECICNKGWTDTLCDVDVNECNLSPPRCENNGTCTNTQGSFNCTCPPGFSGPTCSEDIRDPCSSGPCGNGTCIRLTTTTHTCQCALGFTGTTTCTAIGEHMPISQYIFM